MRLRLIAGRAGSGKSTRCLEKLFLVATANDLAAGVGKWESATALRVE